MSAKKVSQQREAKGRRESGSSRKVVQLVTMPGYSALTGEHGYRTTTRVVEPTLYALCDDGSIWAMDGNHDKWISISTKSIREGIEFNAAARRAQPQVGEE